ncbi:MAG: helix-turn-helix transcriptional regulator [Bacteroidales bacterium]|nr:helix-turn-helix transcriptional regulator [Bacteroidales bacterium]
MLDRISLILKHKNLTSAKFADEIGVQRSSISHVLSGRNKPSLEFIQKILKTYPEISSDWILFGKGKMMSNQENETEVKRGRVENDLLISKLSEEDEKAEVSGIEKIKNVASTTSTLANKQKNSSINADKKEVEKIIVFYTDDSFKQYIPE